MINANWITDVTFADKDFFWLFLAVPVMIAWPSMAIPEPKTKVKPSRWEEIRKEWSTSDDDNLYPPW